MADVASGLVKVTGAVLVCALAGPGAASAQGGSAAPAWPRSGGDAAAEAALRTPGGVDSRPAVAADSLTLEDAVVIALERNRDLAAARLTLANAGQQVREAWGAVLPSVDVSASYNRNLTVPRNFLPAIIFDPDADPDELIPVQFGADNTWGLQVQLEQPLFQAQAFIGVGAASRYRALQEELVRGVAQQVVTRVRIAYHDVLLAAERVRLRENSLARIRRTLEETRALEQAGVASSYDVLRLEVQLANLEPELRRARDTAAEARRGLAVELGSDATDTLRVTGSLLGVDPAAVTAVAGPGEAGEPAATTASASAGAVPVERLLQRALTDRSDLRQLGLTEELRTAELRAAQAEYAPRVSLFGTYSINAQHNGTPDFFGPDARYRSYGRVVGVQVTVPLFTGFQRDARVGQRRAALREAEVQRRLVRAQAGNQVRTLAARLEESRDRARAQRGAVDQAQRGFEIARARYREGVGSRLDVTDAEVALRESEFNYAQAVYDLLGARARLDRAVGTVPGVDMDIRRGLDGRVSANDES